MDLSLIFGVLCGMALVVYGLQVWAVRSTLKERDTKESPEPPSWMPPISVLKPLKGLEDNLFDNLASLCIQDYPEYEILCSVQDVSDPAFKVARKVKEKYPGARFRILVEPCDEGLNPKVNNLIPAYRRAQYSTVLISDSNVVLDTDYLKRIVRPLEEGRVGLVNNLIRGVRGKTLGSVFENLHLNSFILANICFLNKVLDIPCVVGKSMLMRKHDLESIGGLAAFANVLAEDHCIGEKIRATGKHVVVSSYLVNNVNEYWSVRRFMSRHTRWAKMRWSILGLKYFLELLTNPVFLAGLPIPFSGPASGPLLLALSVAFMKGMGDLYLGCLIGARIHPALYLLSPVKDLLIGMIWFVPFVSDTVTWRGNRYLMGKNTVLSPCPESGIWAWRYKVMDALKARVA
jgi:ceramide glucosyltransferase